MTIVSAVPRQPRPEPTFVPKRVADVIAALGTAIEPDWIVPGYVGPGLVTILGAKPKVGKSTLAASLIAVAKDGGEWLGLPVRKCRALWLDLEMGESQTARAFIRAGLSEGEVWLWSGHRDGFDDAELRAFIEDSQIELLVIDSLSKYSQVEDENNNAKLTKELNTLVRITRDLNVAIVLIHHQKKSTDRTIDDLRGGGAIAADADIILNLYRVQDSVLSNPRRRLMGSGRFMDVTPADTRIILRDGRYMLDAPGSATSLPRRQQEALDALGRAASPLSYTEWKLAAQLPGSTFKSALAGLVESNYVQKTGQGNYQPTAIGLGAAATLKQDTTQ
jgi:replicative DNA helicase